MNHEFSNLSIFFMQTGRGVPVLIPKETNKVLEYLSDPVARQMASIRPENKYMFANTGEW